MMEQIRKHYTGLVETKIREITKEDPTALIVFSSITPYITIENFSNLLIDKRTFDKEGDYTLFDNNWIMACFTTITQVSHPIIFSHQQYAYFSRTFNVETLRRKVYVIYDNIRSLFPMSSNFFKQDIESSGVSMPSEDLPVYQAEQFKIGEHFYYSLKEIEGDFKRIPLFDEVSNIEITDEKYSILDVDGDNFSLDLFVNECIESGNFSNRVAVHKYENNTRDTTTDKLLPYINSLLHLAGGGIYNRQEPDVQDLSAEKNDESLRLLHQYWGENASFRDIRFYRNPNINNDIEPISQQVLIDTIINEYENARKGRNTRDIFITAPTGAGKSMIFQIPAFYASEQGDVTIVISPLKALMNDQVNAIKNSRGFSKVAYLNSDLSLTDRNAIIDQCRNGGIDILYMSPELLLSYDIHNFIGERHIGMIVIDEAHLITTWGRDFRVDYWFLGIHLNKLRKYSAYKFPLIALTATAVYGGTNDMVFDSINSLYMHDPHLFIGDVRRNDIRFIISQHRIFGQNYTGKKESECLDTIKRISQLGLKMIVYVPYVTHAQRLKAKCDQINPNLTVTYYSDMNAREREISMTQFRNNNCKVIICTKAFGMGVDIPDIQVVYHFAPSGLLPDYVQEIGRAARGQQVQGYASLSFSKEDLRFSKSLFGISSIQPYQLQGILIKLIQIFKKNGMRRNLLVSPKDFEYLFPNVTNDDDLKQKVLTALMMLEKDYLNNKRFNVLIARPKQVFSIVYAKTDTNSFNKLLQYDPNIKVLYHTNDVYNIQLNLEKIWENNFPDMSFPLVKRNFYEGKFLANKGIHISALVKVTISLSAPYDECLKSLQDFTKAAITAFSNLKDNKFHDKEDYLSALQVHLNDSTKIDIYTEFLLSTFSLTGQNDGNMFIRRRGSENKGMEYQVFNNGYFAKLNSLIQIFNSLFKDNEGPSATRYISAGEIELEDTTRLGSLLELMGMGTYEAVGGNSPKIFVRINDPYTISRDSRRSDYTNSILESVRNRHKISCELFEYFFTHQYDNEERWNFIEDFFLGKSSDELLKDHPGSGDLKTIDIPDSIRQDMESNCITINNNTNETNNDLERFAPQHDHYYDLGDRITIDNDCMTIDRWITSDPIRLHKTIESVGFKIPPKAFKTLANKLRINFPQYYRDIMGLKLLINYPGYNQLVQASVPYSVDPVGFYKWIQDNPNTVHLSMEEKIRLFDKVRNSNPNVLKKRDLKILDNQ